MRIWRLSILALLLAATAACDGSKHDRNAETPAPPAPRTAPAVPSQPVQSTELVSLAWRPANSNQNLQAFDLEVSGLDVLAVCHVPPGWTINATGAGEGVTQLKGQATVGAAYVSLDDMQDIAGLFLVRARAGEPLAVEGEITTGVYGGDQTVTRATPALLRREAAERCPPPKG